MKTCRHCNTEKPLFAFNKKCDTADGLTSRCKDCLSEIRKADYAKRSEVLLARNAEWYSKNRDAVTARRRERHDSEKCKVACKRYYENNRDKVRSLNKAWEEKNKDKVLESWRNYSKRNIDMRNANSAARRAAKRRQCPDWDRELTDLTAREASRLARMRSSMFGFKWDVDHIVPICGKNVSGFHVWSNLQVIPATVNRAKSNKHEVSA